MKASEDIKKFIKNFESCQLKAYKCTSGILTIGYGHTKNVYAGQVITQQQADKFFDEDLQYFENHINSKKLFLNQNQFDALVSLCYNIGPGGFDKSPVLKLIKINPEHTDLRTAFLIHTKSKGKILQGLVKRRNAEYDWYINKH